MSDKQPLYVVGLDGSKNSAKAADFAAELALKTDAKLLLVHIINWSGFQPVSALEIAERPVDKKQEEKYTKEKILEPVLKKVNGKGVEADTYFTWGHPGKGTNKIAEKKNADMIFVGRSGHSTVTELVIGSVANSLAHSAKLPVVLIP